MSLDEGISALIGRIYQGAHDPLLWNAAMEDVIARTRSRFIMAATLDTRRLEFSGTTFHGAIDGPLLDGFQDYQSHMYKLDPMVKLVGRRPNARHCSSTAAVGGTGYMDQPYVRWSIGALGSARWNLAYSAPIDQFLFGVALHSCNRAAGHAAPQVRLFQLLFDHMEQAARLAARPPDLVGEREACLVVNRRGQVVSISERALRLLASADGLALVEGRLVGATRTATARIDSMLVSALEALKVGSAGGALSVERPSGRRPFALSFTPLAEGVEAFAAFQPSALVRIVDPEDGPEPEASARWPTLYGLTPAEVRLAAALLHGEGNLREAAEGLNIAYATARVHLANIFEKTDVRSQAQLARLLTRG